MAQMQQVYVRSADERSVPLSGIINLLGAAMSLALVAGIGFWGYQSVIRDVSGVPVVKAAEGPMRVQPENPGGSQADHQGLSVNDVAAVGTAAKPADRLILAPPPLDLTLDDASVIPAALSTGTEGTGVTDTTDEAVDPVRLAVVEALAEQLASGVDPIGQTDTQSVSEGVAEPVQEVAIPDTPEIEGGLGRSLRPQLRPARLTIASSQDVTLTSSGDIIDIDPDTIPAGTRLAQLGAFASAEIARQEWTRLSDKFSDYLEGKGRVIQRASSGGRIFYRLRAAGFEDLSDARRFCSALVAERAECIPVVTR